MNYLFLCEISQWTHVVLQSSITALNGVPKKSEAKKSVYVVCEDTHNVMTPIQYKADVSLFQNFLY